MKRTKKIIQEESTLETPTIVKSTKKNPHKSWQRLALSSIGIAIILGVWQLATWHLYALPDHSISAFTSITNNAFYIIGALVIFFVTGRLVYEWTNATSSSVVEEAQHISQDIKEKMDDTSTNTNTNINIDESVPNKNLREFQE